MERFYFTYGTSPCFPFEGGWTLVYAPDLHAAIQIFKAYHPHPNGDCLINCSDYYTEEQFEQGDIFRDGNRGAFCHEVIGPRPAEENTSPAGSAYVLIEVVEQDISDPVFFATHEDAHAGMCEHIAKALGISSEEVQRTYAEAKNFEDVFNCEGSVGANSARINDLHGQNHDWKIFPVSAAVPRGKEVYILSERIEGDLSDPETFPTHEAAFAKMCELIAEALGVDTEKVQEAYSVHGSDMFGEAFGREGHIGKTKAWVNDIHHMDFAWSISTAPCN